MNVRVLNFSHPLTEEQVSQISELLGEAVEVIEVPFQLDLFSPLPPQVTEIVDRIGLSSAEFQTVPIVVNLPGLTAGAAVLLAELHGRMGYFPPILSLRREGTPPRFVVAEIIDLQGVREYARSRRSG